VCAVNNQEACARMLLFRGAQRGAQNFANQTPYQVKPSVWTQEPTQRKKIMRITFTRLPMKRFKTACNDIFSVYILGPKTF